MNGNDRSSILGPDFQERMAALNQRIHSRSPVLDLRALPENKEASHIGGNSLFEKSMPQQLEPSHLGGNSLFQKSSPLQLKRTEIYIPPLQLGRLKPLDECKELGLPKESQGLLAPSSIGSGRSDLDISGLTGRSDGGPSLFHKSSPSQLKTSNVGERISLSSPRGPSPRVASLIEQFNGVPSLFQKNDPLQLPTRNLVEEAPSCSRPLLFDTSSPLKFNADAHVPSFLEQPKISPSLFDKDGPLQFKTTEAYGERKPLGLLQERAGLPPDNSGPSLLGKLNLLQFKTPEIHIPSSGEQLKPGLPLFERSSLRISIPKSFEDRTHLVLSKDTSDLRIPNFTEQLNSPGRSLFKNHIPGQPPSTKPFEERRDLGLFPEARDQVTPSLLDNSRVSVLLQQAPVCISPSLLDNGSPSQPQRGAVQILADLHQKMINKCKPGSSPEQAAGRARFQCPKSPTSPKRGGLRVRFDEDTVSERSSAPSRASSSSTRRRGVPIRTSSGTPKRIGSNSSLLRVSRQALLTKKSGDPNEHYRFVSRLGEGSFGVTCLVQNKVTGQERCLKTVNKSKAQLPLDLLEQEFQALALVDHPHVIRLFEYWEDQNNCYFVTEAYKGGTLLDVIEDHARKRKHIDEGWLVQVFQQSLEGIAYCHDRNLIHKDLKSDNMMLLERHSQSNPYGVHCVIIDLGLAECFDISNEALEVAGTPITMAPELWRAAMGLGIFGPKCDIYSLGCVFFRALSRDGVPPITVTGRQAPHDWLEAIKRGPDESQITHASPEAKDLVRKMRSYCEVRRPDALTCLKHRWFVKMAPEIHERASHAHHELTDIHQEALRSSSLQAFNPFQNRVIMMVASQLGAAELQDVNKVFRKYDADNNGTLSFGEMISLLKDLGVSHTAAVEAATSMDIDRDGSIAFTEFVTACISHRKLMERKPLRRVFDEMDANKDGRLSREEVKAAFVGAKAQCSKEEADSLLEDAQFDHTMDFEEFAHLFTQSPKTRMLRSVA